MVVSLWRIRVPGERFDPSVEYDGYPNYFTIKLVHGGKFSKFPNVKYTGGKVTYVDLLDTEVFSVFVLHEAMMKLGYDEKKEIYYQFLIPNGDFQFGLRALGNDDDVRNLLPYVAENKVIRVYTEHGSTALPTYFMSPNGGSSVRIEEIEEEEQETRLVTTASCSKKLFLEWVEPSPVINLDETVTQHEDETVTQHEDETVTQHEDETVTQHEAETVTQHEAETVTLQEVLNGFDDFDPFEGCTFQEDVNVDAGPSLQDDNVDAGPSLQDDNVDAGQSLQDDNVDVGGTQMDVEEEFEEDDYSSYGSDDSDFIDEENEIEDVEVDMKEYLLNVDPDVEYVGGKHKVPTGNGNESDVEDVEVIDNDVWDSLDDESDEDRKRKSFLKSLGKERRCSLGEVHHQSFYVGQKYSFKKDLKNKIERHALETKRSIFFIKNDKTRLRAICKGNVAGEGTGGVGESVSGNKVVGKGKGPVKVKCPWVLHASRSKDDEFWYIKTYEHHHACLATRRVKACTATFISKEIMTQVGSNPNVPIRALKEQLEHKYEIGVSIHKVFRAKSVARKLVEGDYTKQYTMLRDYALELQATNPDTTVKLELVSEPNLSSLTRQFKRMYVCLGPLKKGFKAGMRDFLGLDGCFMKGPFSGEILTAVSVDSNNGIYPLAYALVDKENISSWKWFLECLGDDLDLHPNSNFTFVSDRQKGLLNAVEAMFPNAEHRFCIRHVYDNMRRTWKTKDYKDRLWKCATASTVPEFEALMREFAEFDKEACDWLRKIPLHSWARSHFTGRALSDMLLNNLCEVFNSKLIDGRDKPIITCLEFIREYLMKRICNVMKVMNKSSGPLTPAATKLLDANVSSGSQYKAKWNGSDKYEVVGPWQDQHVVDMGLRTCTCRKWELTGIPCKHVIAAINEMADFGEQVGEYYTYVHKVYWLETWRSAYSHKLQPIKGRSMWPRSPCPITITPPPHSNKPGRPKKKRRMSADEKRSQGQKGSQPENQSGKGHKLTRKWIRVTCSKCGGKGHNSRSCRGQ